MGARANYIITENGRHELFYTHWGADTIPRDFFFGPEVALAVVRASQPSEELLDEVWAEGGALIDLDQHRLCLWGGQDIRYFARLREVWLDLMRISWGGWDVSWASQGVFDLASHIGADDGRLRNDTPAWTRPFDGSSFPTGRRPLAAQTFVTIRRAPASLADVMMPLPVEYALTAGPRLVSPLEQQPLVKTPHEKDGWPYDTLLIDLEQRRLRACHACIVHSIMSQIVADNWSGWTLACHVGGMPEHLRLTGRDPDPFLRPTEDHLKDVATIVLSGNVDTVRLLRNATIDGHREMQVHPLFHEAPRLDLTEKDRMDYFLTVVGRWRRSAGC